MDKKVLLLAGAALIAGLGFASALLFDDDNMHALIAESEIGPVDEPIRFAPTEAQREFQSMAIAADESPQCALPKPPKSVGATALTRNSLQQILRILALQKWQETGLCGCFFDDLSWDAVALAAPNFERSDGVDLRFKLSALRAQADELEAQRLEVCPE